MFIYYETFFWHCLGKLIFVVIVPLWDHFLIAVGCSGILFWVLVIFFERWVMSL